MARGKRCWNLFVVVFSIIVTGTALLCGEHELKFMDRCWCEPGWESANKTTLSNVSLECKIPVLQNGDCECEPGDSTRSFLLNPNWQHPKGYRCIALCRWNKQVGVPRSLISEWKDNQGWKQLPFYMKDLPKARHTHLRERLDEFATAFNNWDYLNNSNFGNVLELGAGGYTQLRNIMEVRNFR